MRSVSISAVESVLSAASSVVVGPFHVPFLTR